MNLSTARTALRAKEIGIRKVVGARKRELVLQFLSESVFIAWSAILIAFALLYVTLPWLNKVSGSNFHKYINEMAGYYSCFFRLFRGFFSGIYPALFMSSFQPVKTLKGLFKVGGSNFHAKSACGNTVCNINYSNYHNGDCVSAIAIYAEKSLGYDKDNLIVFHTITR